MSGSSSGYFELSPSCNKSARLYKVANLWKNEEKEMQMRTEENKNLL